MEPPMRLEPLVRNTQLRTDAVPPSLLMSLPCSIKTAIYQAKGESERARRSRRWQQKGGNSREKR